MKPRPSLRLFLAAIGCSLMAISSAGAQLTWDPGKTGSSDGAGSWLAADVWWDGEKNVTWDHDAPGNAIIGNGGSGGAITLGTVSAGSVLFGNFSGTYTLDGATTGSLAQSGGILIGANAGNVTIRRTTVSGAGGITMNGSGLLNVREAVVLSYTGPTIINGGTMLIYQNLPAGNMTLNDGMLTDYYRQTNIFADGLGADDKQVQIYGDSGFGSGNGNCNWRIGAQDSILRWGDTHFNPTKLKFLVSPPDNMGPSIYGQLTFQNGLDLNGGARTIDVLAGTGTNAIISSWVRITGAMIDASLDGGGSLVKTGGGNLILAGANTYDGGTTINNGALRFESIAAMPYTGNVQVNDGAILGVRLGGSNNWTGGETGAGTLGGLLEGTGTEVTIDEETFTSTVSYSGDVGLLLDVNAATDSSATIPDVGSSLAIYKAGGAALKLSGNNNYTGGTFLYQGTLIADSTNALGGAGDITFRGGTLQYTDASAAVDFVPRIKNSTSAISLNTGGQDVTMSGIASGNTGGLTLSGAGSLTLTGANSYTGTTLVNTGATLVVDGISSLPAGGRIDPRGTVVFKQDGGGTVTNQINGIARATDVFWVVDRQTPGAADNWTFTNTPLDHARFTTLTFRKGVNVESGIPTVTLGTPNYTESDHDRTYLWVAESVNVRVNGFTGSGRRRVLEFSGDTTGNEIFGAMNNHGGNTLSIVKSGSGTWTFSANNGYTGSTTINGGTLALTADGLIASSVALTIEPGGILDVSAKPSYAIPASQPLTFGLGATSSGTITAAELDIKNASVTFTGTPAAAVYVLATYANLEGDAPAFASVTLPSGYTLDYQYGGDKIALVSTNASPYQDWANGVAFTDDANGDGVSNGLAWILGAATPAVSALDKLPVVGTPDGFLTLDFRRVTPYAPAKLFVEYGSDLAGWTSLEIPADSGTIGGDIEVVVTPGAPDQVQVKLPTSHAAGGKLFARLSARED